MPKVVDASLMPVAAEDMWDSERIDDLGQKNAGSFRLLREFGFKFEITFQRDSCRSVVSDEQVERSADDERLGFIRDGFVVLPTRPCLAGRSLANVKTLTRYGSPAVKTVLLRP
ncbi:hypothetical protein [Arthrobacter sp. AZCC_0090]|uniref:hypothetical protein n=1 Tax=Arthrobacter sp. AZCC_0090 TaxID=2735881 RepID=UPI00160751CC|nr:hypothetical protein [Arthrobacter sp. AZCC_0090]MBB6406113.1 hypothetical protein [Arthrobacter sp. AZCC_0090]